MSAGGSEERIEGLLARLCALSIEHRSNVYRSFEWPESLPTDRYWMSPELLTVHGTAVWDELDEGQRMALSRWESIHFYSLNVHGIRELLAEVVRRIHTPAFAPYSEYLHHFMGEENEHMWFFARFCKLYGGKLYPERKLAMGSIVDPETAHFVVFARIQIFEELVDYFNIRMSDDERLHPLIQAVNRAHHQDESRHVAFGRELVAFLHRQLREKLSPERLLELEKYLKGYIAMSIQSLYSPDVYRDSGLPMSPYSLRNRLLGDPVRRERHAEILKRTVSGYLKNGIFTQEMGPV